MAQKAFYDASGRIIYLEDSYIMTAQQTPGQAANRTSLYMLGGVEFQLASYENEARRDIWGTSGLGVTGLPGRRVYGSGTNQVRCEVRRVAGTGTIQVFGEQDQPILTPSFSLTSGTGTSLDPRRLRAYGIWRIVVPANTRFQVRIQPDFRRSYQIFPPNDARWFNLVESELATTPTFYRIAVDRNIPNTGWPAGTYLVRMGDVVTT